MEPGWYIEGLVLAVIEKPEIEESRNDLHQGLLLSHGTPKPYFFGEYNSIVPNPDDLIVASKELEGEKFYVSHVHQTSVKPPSYEGTFKLIDQDNYWKKLLYGYDFGFYRGVQHALSELHEYYASQTGLEANFESEAAFALSSNMRKSKMPKHLFQVWKSVSGLEEALQRFNDTIGPEYQGNAAPLE